MKIWKIRRRIHIFILKLEERLAREFGEHVKRPYIRKHWEHKLPFGQAYLTNVFAPIGKTIQVVDRPTVTKMRFAAGLAFEPHHMYKEIIELQQFSVEYRIESYTNPMHRKWAEETAKQQIECMMMEKFAAREELYYMQGSLEKFLFLDWTIRWDFRGSIKYWWAVITKKWPQFEYHKCGGRLDETFRITFMVG